MVAREEGVLREHSEVSAGGNERVDLLDARDKFRGGTEVGELLRVNEGLVAREKIIPLGRVGGEPVQGPCIYPYR